MKKAFLRYFLNIEYAVASVLVLLMIAALGFLSDNLPEADETSFLNPIFDRIDFLNIEDVSLDAIFAIKDMEYADPRIRLLNIRDVAPVPDGKIARLIRKLNAYGARVIGIDVFFDREHVDLYPEDRLAEIDSLAAALRDNRNVVLATGFDAATLKPSITLDPRIDSVHPVTGYANMIRDDDGVVRRFWPYRTIEGKRVLSLAIQVVALYDSALVSPILAEGEQPQIIHYSGTYLPRYGGQEYQQFVPLAIDDVLAAPPALDAVYRRMFEGSIVLVGYVNDEGFSFLLDTHETPLGRKVGLKGPDMSGIVIHANIVDMVLKHRFIRSVPPLVDWAIPFVLSYLSIALYRVLRTKTTSRAGLATLISATLVIETIIVFFLPIIAFFFFHVKIAYNLSATAVLLFIPANALTNTLRFRLLRARAAALLRKTSHPVARRLHEAFEDPDSFPAHIRTLHAAQSLIQYAFAVRAASCLRDGVPLPPSWENPTVETWRALIPEIEDCFSSGETGAMHRRYFLQFLEGRKRQFMRECSVRDLLLSTQSPRYNEFFYFEEWEILLPHILRMFFKTLRPYLASTIVRPKIEDGKTLLVTYPGGIPLATTVEAAVPGDTHAVGGPRTDGALPLEPFCVIGECKLHRREELFVFHGRVPRQFALPPFPIYAGDTVACEPVLPDRVIRMLERLSEGTRIAAFTRASDA
ncbi:MAG: CHASE2 domain-containing protein [Bacteroidota bacterium]|nr:CHASE2 domain-containing protein [Bacteroidota bacterium]